MVSFLTWNIWFSEKKRNERTFQIMEQLHNLRPDVVAFQEVTPDSLKIIKNNKKDYHILGLPLSYGYDTVILSRFPALNWSRYQLPHTQMGRNILLVELSNNLFVGTFHLESIFSHNSEKIKSDQLNYIEAITPQNTILMGDTNLKTEPATNMQDIFMHIGRPLAYENTYSGENMNVRNKRLHSRLDRIYQKSENKIEEFYLIKDRPHPSDHFGLFCRLKIKDYNN